MRIFQQIFAAASKAVKAGTTKKGEVDKWLFMYMLLVCMTISFGTGIIISRRAMYASDTESGFVREPLLFLMAGKSMKKYLGDKIVLVDDTIDDVSASEVNEGVSGAATRRLEVGKNNDNFIEEVHMNFETPSIQFLNKDKSGLEKASTMSDILKKSGKERLPAGQQISLDLKNVDATFLSSKDLLSKAIVNFVKDSDFTLISYTCNPVSPVGITCMCLLLQSHFTLHTWPDEGIVTMDLFTTGTDSLLTSVDNIKRNFGVARNSASGVKEEITEMWSHTFRGFTHNEEQERMHHFNLQSDLNIDVTSQLDTLLKEQIVSTQSQYQRIDIWDIKDLDDTPTYEDSIKHDLQPGDVRYTTPDVSAPDRILFLDEANQVVVATSEECDEAHVHPAMFSHLDPRSVAIVGGGDGGVLRQILKHKTVEKVKLIEIDSMVIDVSKKFLPKICNCSDIVGLEDSCFDDSRTEVIISDALSYFKEHFNDAKGVFDIIISDALSIESPTNLLSKSLYTDEDYISALMASLTPEGILAIPIGGAPGLHDPKELVGINMLREQMMLLFEKNPDTSAMFVYEYPNCIPDTSLSVLVVCKSSNCRNHWYANADITDKKISERIRSLKNGKIGLMNYDGSTQKRYQNPPKAWETLYCRREPQPKECVFRGLDYSIDAHELDEQNQNSGLHIKALKNDENGVFASIDIKKGDYILPNDMASSVAFPLEGSDHLKERAETFISIDKGLSEFFGEFISFVEKNGHNSVASGQRMDLVEVGASRFIREAKSSKKANVGGIFPREKGFQIPKFSPVYERYSRIIDVFLVATRDIASGEELLKVPDVWGY